MQVHQQSTTGNVGGDHAFMASALSAGHKVNAVIHDGGQHLLWPTESPNFTLQIQNPEQISLATPAVLEARSKLEAEIPKDQWAHIYLAHAHVVQTQSFYGVGNFSDTGRPDSVRIDGLVGWACQLFLSQFLPGDGLLPIYFFSQDHEEWFQCRRYREGAEQKMVLEWRPIQEVPRPIGRYAATGAYYLTDRALQAIRDLFLPTGMKWISYVGIIP